MNNYIPLNGLVVIAATSVESDTYNGVDGGLLQDLTGLRGNIQSQIDTLAAGATIDSNLHINSLITEQDITSKRDIYIGSDKVTDLIARRQAQLDASSNVTVGQLNASTINLGGSSVSSLIAARQSTINTNSNIAMNRLDTNYLWIGGTDINTMLSSKQSLLGYSSDITVRSININGTPLATTLSNMNNTINGKQQQLDSSSDITVHSVVANGINLVNELNNKINTIQVGTLTQAEWDASLNITATTTGNTTTLDFVIPRGYPGLPGPTGAKGDQGDRGPKGDKGDKGDNGTSVDIGDVISGVLSAGTIVALGTSIATIEGEIATIEGEILTLQGQLAMLESAVETLQAKTAYMSVVGSATRFQSEVQINNGIGNDVVLKTGAKSEFYRGIHSTQAIECDGNVVAQGAVSGHDVTAGGNLVTSGDNTLGSVLTSTNNINGSVLNVNCLSINLNGIVSMPNSWINQLGF